VNNCDRENIESKQGKYNFRNKETLFWHFQSFLKMLNLFSKIVKENGEGSIEFIFYQLH